MSTYADRPHMQITSLVVNALPAMLATVALVLLMHSLIATDMNPPDIPERQRFDFITEVPEITDPLPILRPEKPLEVAQEPERMEPQLVFDTQNVGGLWSGDTLLPVTERGPITAGTNMVVPYLKLQPEYPSRAIARGIQGFVDLAFDITAAGTTSNIRIIEAQPEGVFERAAIRALEKWKYKVPVVDGTPQGQVDMMTRLTFQLEE
ncbi:MAG: TonB family protein [Pseudomonadota bacterium]